MKYNLSLFLASPVLLAQRNICIYTLPAYRIGILVSSKGFFCCCCRVPSHRITPRYIVQCAYFVQTHFHIHIPLTPHMSESSNLYYNYTVGCRYMANACTLHAHLPSDSSSRIMCRLFSSSSFVHVFLFLFLFHLYFCLCWHFSYIACVYCFHDFCVLVVWLIFFIFGRRRRQRHQDDMRRCLLVSPTRH